MMVINKNRSSELGKIVQQLFDEGFNGVITVDNRIDYFLVSGISQGERYVKNNPLDYENSAIVTID